MGLSIIPAESFHAHEESSIVCHEADAHYADHSHDCKLADYILPSFHKEANAFYLKAIPTARKLDYAYFNRSKTSHHSLIRGRAPPALG